MLRARASASRSCAPEVGLVNNEYCPSVPAGVVDEFDDRCFVVGDGPIYRLSCPL
jgi:hypothetical protein